jgi:hypothetical protein
MRRLPALVALAALPACDGSYAAFLNSVPVADESGDEPVEVILGIDGLSRAAFAGARAQGAFASYHDADLITVFPASSDYAWTRILGTTPLGGYEIEYFDPAENALVNDGVVGLAKHPLESGIAWTLACYQRFDFLGDGETWMAKTYLDPEASLPGTLDELLAALAARTRQQDHFFGFILNLDVIGHTADIDHAVSALAYIDRRIQAFKDNHRDRRYNFTIFGDHGNTHHPAELVEPADILKNVGVASVDSLGSEAVIEAVAVSHVRISYLSLHTHRSQIPEVARRLSADHRVDLAVARLEPAGPERPGRYAVVRRGLALTFSRTLAGQLVVDDPAAWRTLGIDLPVADGLPLAIDDERALALTAGSSYPDIFYRVATAFEHPAAANKADVFISFADDFVALGFHIPGLGDSTASKGFHGSLTAGSSRSVLASEGRPLPARLRADDLLRVLPELAPASAP